MSNWQIYPLTSADQQQHIDASHHLLEAVQPGDRPILYWSQAERTGLVMGFSQRQVVLDSATLVEHQLPVYYRRAGGTAVLVGPHLLDLDVVLPAGHPLILSDIVESYRWFGQAWVLALHRLGVQARLVSVSEAHAQRDLRKQPVAGAYERLMNRACYGSLSPYEVVVGQRKIVGFDMIRRRVGTLLQAGVVLHWESDLLARLLAQNEDERALLQYGLNERAMGLDTLSGRVIQSDEVIAAFEQVLFSEDLFHRAITRTDTH